MATMSERAIFLEALDKDPAERAAFVNEACAGNETLRRGVETLLRLHAAPHCGRVTDLAPLRGMPLQRLWWFGSAVSDLSPLRGMPLQDIHCDFPRERDAEFLRSFTTLEIINSKAAAEFWKEVDDK